MVNRGIIVLLILLMLSPWVQASEESEHIKDIQQAINEAGCNWTAGATSVSGLTRVEQHRLTLTDKPHVQHGERVFAPTAEPCAETRFDWRDTNMVTDVRSQGSCGSCWAFSAIGAVESAFLINCKKNLDLSEQHLVSECCSAGSCMGGWPNWALDYIRDTGVPNEECYPYQSQDTRCDPCSGWEDQAYKIKDHVYVEPSTNNFKWALKEYGPISVVLTVPDDWYYYRSGVYEPVRDVGWANHAVVLTGWDDEDGCWFIKNSWGTRWGEQGYARVKYGDLEEYDYAYAVTGIIDQGASPDPDTWFKPVGTMGSSEYSENYRTERAIDGDPGTHWFSEYQEDDPWISFDLGEVRPINSVRAVLFSWALPSTCVLEASGKDDVWRVIGEVELLSNPLELVFPMVECRYVRMSLPETTRGYGTCSEFDVMVAEEEPEPDMSVVLHYEGTPDTVIPIDDGLTGITLMRGNETVLAWYDNI